MSAEIYQAHVVSAADPLGLGRIKVVVPQVSGPAVSPWAAPTVRVKGPAPAPGTTVWVSLDTGDPAKPVYHTGVPTGANGGRILCTSTTHPAAPYPGMEIYESDTGNSLIYTGSGWALQAGWSAWTAFQAGWMALNWSVNTAQYRTGPAGVQLRGSVITGVSPVANVSTLFTLPANLGPPVSAPDLWWPVVIAPGSATFTTNAVTVNPGGQVQLVGGTVTFSGGNLYVNLSPITYTTT